MSKREIVIGAGTASPLVARAPGYGTMRLTGEDVWGEPRDRPGALAVLRRAVELGVNFFDTADFYGPGVTNGLLRDALRPYPDDLIVATKVGAVRGEDKGWRPYGRPEELRRSVENNLRELGLERLPLVHFGMAANAPGDYEESLAAMFEMQAEGKILHVGVTNVTVDQLRKALSLGKVATVENMYGYAQRTTDPESPYGFQGGEVLPLCEEHRIPFVPFFSLQTSLPNGQDRMDELARARSVTAAQLNVAWLLHRYDLMLPIPGTTSVKHLEENVAAGEIPLSEEEMALLG